MQLFVNPVRNSITKNNIQRGKFSNGVKPANFVLRIWYIIRRIAEYSHEGTKIRKKLATENTENTENFKFLVRRKFSRESYEFALFSLIFSVQGIQLYVGFGKLLRGSNNEKNYALLVRGKILTIFLRRKLKNEKSSCLAAAFSLTPRRMANKIRNLNGIVAEPLIL